MIKIKSNIKKITYVYEDDFLIVINKPKNILVHKTTFNEQNTLIDVIKNKINLKEFKDEIRPGIVQRLDRNTTGLMVVAKNLVAYDNLIKQINENDLVRKYLAIVHNKFNNKHLIINCPIIRSKKNNLKMVVSDDPKAKEAITEVFVKKTFNNLSLIECILKTGRTHQIRTHMNYIHHPIYNDPIYGKNEHEGNYDQFLHSYYLRFFHPITNALLEFESAPDSIFKSVIK